MTQVTIRAAQENLGVALKHALFVQIHNELHGLLRNLENAGGGAIPLFGPTRVGKTQVTRELFRTITDGVEDTPERAKFAMGEIPPKPSDRDLYRAILRALGLDCGPRERTNLVRERVIRAIEAMNVRYILLDECSHCAERGANLSIRGATDHFKTIIDETGIVLVLAGLPKFQELIDQNEQFRDRCVKSVIFPPYSWKHKDHQSAFFETFLTAIDQIQEGGIAVIVDDEDICRRLYGVSGGRIGMMLRVLHFAVGGLKRPELSLKDIARAAKQSVQNSAQHELYFASDAPTDHQLLKGYVSVMKEAGLPVDITTAAEFEAYIA